MEKNAIQSLLLFGKPKWNGIVRPADEGALPTSKNMAQQRGKAKAPYSTRDSKSGQMDGCGGKAKNVCECDKSMQAPCDLGICALHAGASVRHQVARRRMSRLAEECRRHLGNRVQLAGRTLATQSGNSSYCRNRLACVLFDPFF